MRQSTAGWAAARWPAAGQPGSRGHAAGQPAAGPAQQPGGPRGHRHKPLSWRRGHFHRPEIIV